MTQHRTWRGCQSRETRRRLRARRLLARKPPRHWRWTMRDSGPYRRALEFMAIQIDRFLDARRAIA